MLFVVAFLINAHKPGMICSYSFQLYTYRLPKQTSDIKGLETLAGAANAKHGTIAGGHAYGSLTVVSCRPSCMSAAAA